MKRNKFLSGISILFIAAAFTACSQCYECTTTSEILDGQGNVIDETKTTEDFCTANTEEVNAKEDAGADCRSI